MQWELFLRMVGAFGVVLFLVGAVYLVAWLGMVLERALDDIEVRRSERKT